MDSKDFTVCIVHLWCKNCIAANKEHKGLRRGFANTVLDVLRGKKPENVQIPGCNSAHIKMSTKCKGVKLKENYKEEKVRKWWRASVSSELLD